MQKDEIKKIIFNPVLVFVQNFIPVYLSVFTFIICRVLPHGSLNNKSIKLYFIIRLWVIFIYTPISFIWGVANYNYCKKNRIYTRITQDTLNNSIGIFVIYFHIIAALWFITHVGI